ncbi:MAG: right-handed parallel beta-helix repeat-containing protein [Kiritimatiellae bacterium]|nr:right-handed parallel beta-helix repeat-containing protein [Kiritimatiellia bacterium]
MPSARLSCLIFLMLAALSSAADPTLYVAPDGRDDRSGRSPAEAVATPARALELARALRAAEPDRATPLVIAIAEGLYELPAPLELSPADSGTAAAPLVIEAAPGGRPVLSGGRRLVSWNVLSNGWWQLDVRPLRPFAQLYVNGQRRFRPALPRGGYFHLAAQAPEGQLSTAIPFRQDQVRPEWIGPGVEVLLFHVPFNWSASRLPVVGVEAEGHWLTTTGRMWTSAAPGSRYRLDNVQAALGEPGDWFYDPQTSALTYVPLVGESPATTVAVVPQLPVLLKLRGDPAGRPVEHVVIRGLTFAHSSWTLPADGYSFCQAEAICDAALQLSDAREVVIERCDFRHLGGYAIEAGDGCADVVIRDCDMTDLGAGGVKLGTIRPERPANRCVVRNCRIEGGGRVHPAAVGVFIGHSASNIVEHNEISDFYYTGISLGWTWSTNANPAHHNRIAMNHIFQIGQGVLSDMGGIYTLGRQPGTVLVGNRIHDVSRDRYGGWGIYLDEGSSQMLVESNLAYRTQDAPFHTHAARENRLIANVFALGTNAAMQFSNKPRLGPFELRRNVWLALVPRLVERDHEPKDDVLFERNLYWCAAGAVEFPGGLDLARWRAREPDAEVNDPGFCNPVADDYSFAPNSPAAARIGPEPPWRRAGLLQPRPRPALPPVPRAFPPAHVSPPPPLSLREGFERLTVGQPWFGMIASSASPRESALITEETAAAGRRSLEFRDGPSTAPGREYDPHLHLMVQGYSNGVVQAGMDLRWDNGAMPMFELRDALPRYREGPYVLIHRDGTVESGGSNLFTVAAGEWVRYDVFVPVGSRRTGTYRLEVRRSGAGAPQVYDALPIADSFQAVHWFGIIAHGTNECRFFVDNVTLCIEPPGER